MPITYSGQTLLIPGAGNTYKINTHYYGDWLGPLRGSSFNGLQGATPLVTSTTGWVIDSTNLASSAGCRSIAGMSSQQTQTSCSSGSTIQG